MQRCYLPDFSLVLQVQFRHCIEPQFLVAQTEDRNARLGVRCLASNCSILCQRTVSMAAGPFDPFRIANPLGVILEDVLNQNDIPTVIAEDAGRGLAKRPIYRKPRRRR